MDHEQLVLGLIAIGAGVLVGAVLFVPFVAVSYRRRGALSLGRIGVWAAALVYSWAIWTYTLLPLPDPDTLTCVGSNTHLLKLVDDISGATTLTDPVVMQLVLNVALFVPLGFFMRVLGGRGIVAAGLAGLALSAFIETTQLTGVWGLYPCAYRVFDVDDLVTNTTGALLGSVLALAVPRRLRGRGTVDAEPDLPRPVTRSRRLLAMAADWLGFTLTTVVVTLAVQAYVVYVRGGGDGAESGANSSLVGAATATCLWFVVTMLTGRTVGDLAVQLRFAGGPLPAVLARLLRLGGGIGGYAALALLPGAWARLSLAYALALIAAALVTARGRGLAGVLSGQPLLDARDGAAGAERRAASGDAP